jgi:hypothetical protein
MANTDSTAEKWTEFVASRPEFPAAQKLLAAFRAGKITRLCDCGCNAYEFEVPEDAALLPLARSGGYGSIFEMEFEVTAPGNSPEQGSLEFIVFVDKRGHFAGIEVDFCGNSYPVPDALTLHEVPYHVRCSTELDA